MAEIKTISLFRDANLQGYWRCEDVNDSSSHALTLTNEGSVTFTSAKFFNGANMGTPNTTNYLDELTNNLNVDGTAITISLWIKLLAEIGAGTFGFANQQSLASHTFNIMYYEYNGGTPRLAFQRYKNGVGGDISYGTATLGTSKFNHIVYVYDNTNVRGYLNGVNVATNVAASGSGSSGGGNGFQIGRDPFGNLVPAIIDDVAVFNRVLTDAEILNIYNAGGGFFNFM